MANKCSHCGANVQVPENIEVMRLVCPFCRTEQETPDIVERRRKQAALAVQQREQAEREARERSKREDRVAREREHKRDKNFWRGQRLWILFALSIGPTVALSQMYDLPHRWVGESGRAQVQSRVPMFQSLGCQSADGLQVAYVHRDSVSRSMEVKKGDCFLLLASGGDGHDRLKGEVFSVAPNPVAVSEAGKNVDLRFCPAQSGVFRWELMPTSAGRGRISWQAFTCPRNHK